MAAIAGYSSEGKPDGIYPEVTGHKVSEFIEENIPWMDYVVQQAQIAQKTAERNIENAIEVTKSRFDRIITTSSSHFNQTIDSLQTVKSDCSANEDIVFGKIKEAFLYCFFPPVDGHRSCSWFRIITSEKNQAIPVLQFNAPLCQQRGMAF